ncbi:MAG: dephospho-CoA kinase, partial [Deltaproteobacteria bacterium]|nr:dephospho-CoA kinase [Deltaproteobacteria bacterium]
MPASRDWGKLVRRMELLLRLKSFPVAFKLLKKKEMLSEIPYLRRMTHKSTLCQLISVV